MDLTGLLKQREVELSTGHTITVRELSYKGYCEMRDAAQQDDNAMAGAVTVWYGVPEFQDRYTPEDIATLMPIELLDEITGHVMDISGVVDQEEAQGNLEAEQSAA